MIDEKKPKKQLINELVELRQRIVELETSANQSKWAIEGMEECLLRHSDMQRIAHIGNWSWNIQTNELLWSDENYRNFGISREEVSHSFEAFVNYVHPEDIECVKKAIDDALQGKKKCNIDFRIIKPDGLERYVNAQAEVAFDEAGKPIRMTGILQDITERKRAEEALRESEEKFRSITTAALDAIVSMDELGRIYYMNKAGERIFGYTAEDVIGKDLHALLVPEKYYDAYKKGFGIFKAAGKGKVIGKVVEFSALRKDGTEFPVEISVSALRIQSKWHAVGVIRDITDRKKAEETRLEKERIEYASRAKSDFIASMSHELRTPLNAVIGFSELLGQKVAGGLNEKQENYVNDILTSGKFLLNLINDSLDLSKVEAGKIEMNIEKMSVPDAIEETLTLIKEKATKHNVIIKKQFDTTIEFIEADKQRFKQVLFNLLSNAVKFSKEEGGTVTISMRRVKDMAQFSISDTGIGIKPENMGKLFQKFGQLEAGITNKYGGTGLGLAISKQLVEMHGGKIWAESEFGQGSTFTFLLPLKAEKASQNS